MGDTKTTLTWLLRDQVSPTVGKLDKKLGGLEKSAGRSGGALGGLGSKLGFLVNPLALAAGGATLLTGALAASVKGAAAEQKNIAKLNASLKANVKGWNGNTDAIERTITKREDLAFSDDDLRDSLAILVGSTKDVTQATDLQALAMDLARYKGVSLASASEALAKANAGSTRELKALGIEVDKGATKTEIFGAIQRTVAGQAAGYAGTMQGKWEAFQIKLGDVSEEIGAKLLPIMMDFADWLATDGIGTIRDMVDALLAGVDAAHRLGLALGLIKPTTKGMDAIARIPPAALGAGGGGAILGRAAGGPVEAGETYLVGEHEPELLQMGSRRGTIIPTAGGGRPVQVPVVIDGREIARLVDDHLFYSLNTAIPRAART